MLPTATAFIPRLIRANSDEIEWSWYRLLLCNCQHWAELVVNGLDNRRADCRRP